MQRLLAGDGEPLETLRNQHDSAFVVGRKLTGSGFFLYFCVPAGVERLANKPSFRFGDVVASIDGLQFGAGFILHVKDGSLDALEGYSYEEPWPREISNYSLSIDAGLSERKKIVLGKVHQP